MNIYEQQIEKLQYIIDNDVDFNDNQSSHSDENSDSETEFGEDEESPNGVVYNPLKIKNHSPPFNYSIYDWFKKEGLPDFMLILLDHPYMLDEQKHIVVNDFYFKYFNNYEFAKSVQGGNLVFVNKIYVGIYFSDYEIMKLANYEIPKYSIPIFDVNINGSYITVNIEEKDDTIYTSYNNHKPKFIGVKTIIVERTSQNEKINITDRTKRIHVNRDKNFKMENEYFVDCSITHNPEYEKYTVYPPFNENDEKLPKKLLYDLGCTTTSLFTPQMWDFENNWITSKYPRISKHWKKIIGSIKPVKIALAVGSGTIVNQIYLTKPLYVRIGNLDHVSVNTFFIPLDEDENELFLLGLDVINQHSSIISRFDGKVKLVIMNQKDEFTL